MARFARILVATDGSPSCAAAVDTAVELAAELGAELVPLSIAHEADAADADLSSVADPIGAAEAGTMAIARDDETAVEAEASDHARAVAERAGERGVTARWIAWEGSPGEAIVAAACAEHADLVVCGSHCRSAFRRLVDGSVSDHVIHHSPVPVLVVRPSS